MKRACVWMLLIGCGSAEKAAPTSNVAAAPPPSASARAGNDDSADGEISAGLVGIPNLDAGMGVASSNVLLSRPSITNVIRQNFSKIRGCYEDGIRRGNPDLAGKITVKFTIGKSGAVTKAEPAPDTKLPDEEVVKCVVDAFGKLVFPKPDSTEVVVAYPLTFRPQ